MDHHKRVKVAYKLMNMKLMIKNMIMGSPLKGGRVPHVWQRPDNHPPPAKIPSAATIMIIIILLFILNLVVYCDDDDVVGRGPHHASLRSLVWESHEPANI